MRSFLAALVLATAPLATAAPRLTPSHMVDVWYAWPKPTAKVAVTMEVTIDPGLASSYYWSHFFVLEGTRDGEGTERQAYMGLQTSGGAERAVIFSAWNAIEAGRGCETFGGEGVGYKCHRAYAWKAGHAYRFEATAIGNDWWRGTVTDATTGAATVIGLLRMPAGAGRAVTSVLFDEYYREVESCTAMAPASITFTGLSGADGMTPQHTGTITPGPCGALSKVAVQEDRVVATTGATQADLVDARVLDPVPRAGVAREPRPARVHGDDADPGARSARDAGGTRCARSGRDRYRQDGGVWPRAARADHAAR